MKRTPLHALHLEHGARMAPFAGYDMPIQYKAGVLKEHLHTRASAGLFDVSHMGQVIVTPKTGDVKAVAAALERLVPVDVQGIAPGRQRYAFFTNAKGGILDDLMISHRGDHLLLVVNAGCKDNDTALLTAALSDVATVTLREDLALVALQGPKAAAVLTALGSDADAMKFMDIRALTIAGIACVAARSGYTGEDGFEISVPADKVESFVRELLENSDAMLAGLGARDSLRLEAGLCLYGSDIDEQTTPVEAALTWAIQKVRRTGGARAGGYPGADIIQKQLDSGAPRVRVGLKAEARNPVRGGAVIYSSPDSQVVIGTVTSGGFGPTADWPVAMGYVDRNAAAPGTTVHADVRGKRLSMQVVDPIFVPHRYKR
ncbi:MAG: glycine cleavage system aminomethyltransferase GcvT [Pseudolabrys sp.]|nr:glycine cleavage system aminomethyltransferase GcvT [Pseudolabrys sp.]